MGERNILNKYYPPDFDPARLPRLRKRKNEESRMMLPMSIRCNTCGNYIYKGTKFNSIEEVVTGETYVGIQICRLYFKCTNCSAEIAIKTDPKNSDYVVEFGATRNFEPWRVEEEETKKKRLKRESEELGNPMKSLENRSSDSKREMDIVAALDELKSMKSRQATVDFDAMLLALQRTAAEKENKLEEDDADDEAMIKSIFRRSKGSDEDFDDDDGNFLKRRKVTEEAAATKASFRDDFSSKSGLVTGQVKPPSNALVKISVVKKPGKSYEKNHEKESANNNTSTALQSLCQNYESDDD